MSWRGADLCIENVSGWALGGQEKCQQSESLPFSSVLLQQKHIKKEIDLFTKLLPAGKKRVDFPKLLRSLVHCGGFVICVRENRKEDRRLKYPNPIHVDDDLFLSFPSTPLKAPLPFSRCSRAWQTDRKSKKERTFQNQSTPLFSLTFPHSRFVILRPRSTETSVGLSGPFSSESLGLLEDKEESP